MKRFAFNALLEKCWPVRRQCHYWTSVSGYYARRKRAPTAAAPALPTQQAATQRISIGTRSSQLIFYLDNFFSSYQSYLLLKCPELFGRLFVPTDDTLKREFFY